MSFYLMNAFEYAIKLILILKNNEVKMFTDQYGYNSRLFAKEMPISMCLCPDPGAFLRTACVGWLLLNTDQCMK